MSRSIKSALAVVAIAAMLGLTASPAAVGASVKVNGGATGCCRIAQ